MVAPLALGLVALRLPFEAAPNRARLLRWYGLSLLPMIPAAWLVVRSPVFEDSSTAVKAANFVTTLVPRASVLVLPVGLVLLFRRRRPAWTGPAAFAVTAAPAGRPWRPLLLPEASGSLWRQPDGAMLGFLASPTFEPGATYRVLGCPASRSASTS